ncbi:U3 small nucleolar RNA-associated protein 18 homolog [Hyla sarda]|uniref:U3 small nucleolar RNA-associated protein 18 homolog n=1 Tax=Hyla sarda TaxID=327740 RepID=UPI0024C3D9A5|nr:U3 small nucleolar RNA-associated protein 18 homolog [Hyla sarda]XP_056406590.1 U3 small nucleolar RNA-associated protein 18 homolog [Hyla sarda]XP_056406591.1 U3 small nucleolar RNA-associated protein 18 homolog [Hyla sarda]XP_056406592.1 U3 small nucleolar RNA-associated protein 18 homolog [Hyla sarda]XP_056406593.1 U3 small nucleolar RNA-associated protein 18 homolog [Hyla sarda]XP_056406594.1 U3 small nucleolar RNA-associated protein 18 homolog [Hyla sarda]
MLPAKRKSPGGPGPSRTSEQQSHSRQQDAKKREEELRVRNLKKLSATLKEEEKLHEILVFGGEDEFVDRLLSDTKIRVDPSADLLDSDDDDDDDDDGEKEAAVPSKKPAWVDEDDEMDESIEMTHRYRKDMMKSKAEKTLSKEKLQIRLQQEFQKAMGGVPSWASRDPKRRLSKADDDDDDDEDDEDNLLSKTGDLLAKSTYLPKGILEIKRCAHANSERPSNGPLTTVQFHPAAQVVMTAGLDHSISLFQVDGKLNPKIQSIYLEKFPVYKARFSADGEQVIATGVRHRIFYVYDMMSGSIIPVPRIRSLEENVIKKFEVSPDGSFLLLSGAAGYLHMLSMKSKELIGSMKMNACAAQAVFSPDCSKIFSTCDSGEVYVWDVKSRRCLNRFADDGSLRSSSLAVSKDGRYVSCGSDSGVVNVYSYDDCLQNSAPKPIKSIMNLVTAATSQVFNPCAQILAVASEKLDDAVKLVHIPSFTVFSNFPVQSKNKFIHCARAMDFSPNSGFFSIANNKGEALLYRLKHYSDF